MRTAQSSLSKNCLLDNSKLLPQNITRRSQNNYCILIIEPDTYGPKLPSSFVHIPANCWSKASLSVPVQMLLSSVYSCIV